MVHDRTFGGWNLPIPSLEEEYRKTLKEEKKELVEIIDLKEKKGMRIKEADQGGEPTKGIVKDRERCSDRSPDPAFSRRRPSKSLCAFE
ncbi:MAG TPA: hypothetical protein DCP92_09365 [Nitrospiraceae bacterium]|nr:hypothetical protein [Nitrospiraceae bacterium]